MKIELEAPKIISYLSSILYSVSWEEYLAFKVAKNI